MSVLGSVLMSIQETVTAWVSKLLDSVVNCRGLRRKRFSSIAVLMILVSEFLHSEAPQLWMNSLTISRGYPGSINTNSACPKLDIPFQQDSSVEKKPLHRGKLTDFESHIETWRHNDLFTPQPTRSKPHTNMCSSSECKCRLVDFANAVYWECCFVSLLCSSDLWQARSMLKIKKCTKDHSMFVDSCWRCGYVKCAYCPIKAYM